MNFDVDSRTIYRVVHGSRAYGLATPTSDLDVKGICIEPRDYHLGYAFKCEQQERLANKGRECDSVIYSLRKFVKLAADCNPNIIEVLFVNEKHFLYIDDFGHQLREVRDSFLSKKARHTFAGYAYAQVKRIETHRRWLLSPPSHMPTRTEYGLPERPVIPTGQLQTAQALVQKHLDRWQFNDMSQIDAPTRTLIQETLAELLAEAQIGVDARYQAACRFLGFNENFVEMLFNERKYKIALDEWNHFQSWKKNRNEARAAGEREHGYDLKYGSHCLRLMRMCKEILSGQGVIVERPDAEELLAIKLHGVMKYDALLSEIERLNNECTELYKTSSLPHHPDVNKLNDLVVGLTHAYLERHG